MYKVICFDLDGTLIESVGDIANAMNKVLTNNNSNTHSVDAYKTFIGDGAEMLVKRALGNNYNENTFDSIVKEYKEVYNNDCLNLTFVYDDVIATLNKLKVKYKLAVISNKPYVDTVKVVNHYFPNTFDYIYGKKDDVEKKPHQESMLLMMNHYNVSNNECLYIGDSHVDYAFASNSNVKCLILPYGYPKEGFLESITNEEKLCCFKDILNKI